MPQPTDDQIARAKTMIGVGLDVEQVAQLLATHEADKAEVERLRTGQLQWLRDFFDERYPVLKGPGWLRRDSLRQIVLAFLEEAKAAGGE